MSRRLTRFALVLFQLALSCAASSFDGKVYHGGDLSFQVGPIPASWRTIEAEGTLLAFRDDAQKATIALGARCGKDGDDVPLTALTQHLFLQFTDREPGEQKEITLDGRAALRSTLSAKLDGVPKTFVVIVLKKDLCVYDFLWIKDHSLAGESTEFDRFVDGFHALENR